MICVLHDSLILNNQKSFANQFTKIFIKPSAANILKLRSCSITCNYNFFLQQRKTWQCKSNE